MNGILKQINRSKGGLPKLAIGGPVMLTEAGIEGDWQRNRRYHGGPDKAVLMIAAEVIEGLAASGFPVCPGALGENLTVAGMDPRGWRAGQQYRIGLSAVIELTELRVPCSQLFVYGRAVGGELYDDLCQAGDTGSELWARGGFYARVVSAGWLNAGASVTLLFDVA